MMTLIEELRLAVLELWQTLGLERSSRTAAAVVPALVVGIVLNVIALNIACGLHLRITSAKDGGHWRDASRCECRKGGACLDCG